MPYADPEKKRAAKKQYRERHKRAPVQDGEA